MVQKMAWTLRYLALTLVLFIVGLVVSFPTRAEDLSQKETPGEGGAGNPGEPEGADNMVTRKGVRVEFSVSGTGTTASSDGWKGKGDIPLREGELAEIRFRITDEVSGQPVSPLEPAVWVRRAGGLDGLSCREQIGRYLQGLLSFQADVDLNKYFLLILNDDSTISVVDPLMGVSGVTQLYAMIVLEGRGEGWERSGDDKRLFVTLPELGEVAVVDLDRFEVVAEVETGGRPRTVVLQPDGRYLWVADEAPERGGVSVIDTRFLTVAAHIRTGRGAHRIAFSDDSLTAFVTNGDDDSLSVIDVQKLEKVADLPTGRRPVAVGFSGLRQMAYVASEDGALLGVDAATRRIAIRRTTSPGVRAFRFEPGGRWGFIANEAEDRVDVLDASNGTLVHRIAVGDRPHQIAFTDTYAYVRHLGMAEVTLIPLSQLGQKAELGLQTVSFGSRPPGEVPLSAVADAVSPTGEWTAVVASNPADMMVYYYMEGMIAPMGSYSTYGRVPRAVGVVDRSVRETEKGVYTARFRVPESGDYSVAFLLDSPLVDHCFSFHVAPDSRTTDLAGDDGPLQIEFLTPERTVVAGEAFRLRFALSGLRGGQPLSGLTDVHVLATRPPGVWQHRQRAVALDGGRYEVSVPADAAGAYYVSVAVPSLGVGFTELPFLTFQALRPESPDAEGDRR